jgi:hypothetical protein
LVETILSSSSFPLNEISPVLSFAPMVKG